MTEDGPVRRTTEDFAEDFIATIGPSRWLRPSAGQGAKGRRIYDWSRPSEGQRAVAVGPEPDRDAAIRLGFE